MQIGKLTNETLDKKIFTHLDKKRDDILIRPSIGEDCSAIDFGEYACVLSTDPITGTSEEVGRLAVHVASNDIATAGVSPIGLMMTILAPETLPLEEIETIVKQANEAAGQFNIEIIGGHTEVTSAVTQVIVSMTAIGKQKKTQLINSKNVMPNDIIIMTKTPGIEGTGIIAYEKESELKKVLSPNELAQAKEFLSKISVIPEGVIGGTVGVSAMHDITEGGLEGALWEICEAADLGCLIDMDNVFIPIVTQKICDFYDIDPLKLISSGSMLMIVNKEKVNELMNRLKEEKIDAFKIGEMKEKSHGRYLSYDGEKTQINSPKSDELYRVV